CTYTGLESPNATVCESRLDWIRLKMRLLPFLAHAVRSCSFENARPQRLLHNHDPKPPNNGCSNYTCKSSSARQASTELAHRKTNGRKTRSGVCEHNAAPIHE